MGGGLPALEGAEATRCRLSRRWLFRGMAILLGLMPFCAAEGLCLLCDWGRPQVPVDPFVGFTSINPLFVLSETGEHYETAANRLNFFARETFPAVKGSRTRRIFCLGGSTVQGNPYSIETAFPNCLRMALEEANPGQHWEVINCGGISYASYRLVPILEEVLQYQPDLIVVCSGHNEFLEDRSYQFARQIPPCTHGTLNWLVQRRLVNLGLQWLRGIDAEGGEGHSAESAPAVLLGPEVDPLLDYHNGLAAYHRDPEWQAGVIRQYELNIRRMVELCAAADVPLVLMQPCSNLRGQPPFKSEHSPGMPEQRLAEWEAAKTAASECCRRDRGQALELLSTAVRLNPEHAESWYELGRLQEIHGAVTEARNSLIRARDLDICPLRMITPLERALQRVAQEEQIPFLNVHDLLEERTSHRILGDEWLVDHIHPSFDGHRLIACALLELLEEQGWVSVTVADWQPRAQERFAAHFETLPARYFHKGQRQLRLLRGWTRGECDGPSIESRAPHRVHRSNESAVVD